MVSGNPLVPIMDSSYVKDIGAFGLAEAGQVGGKVASLGELSRLSLPGGIRVPRGFVITTSAYEEIMAEPELGQRLRAVLAPIATADSPLIPDRGHRARNLVYAGAWPESLRAEIVAAYRDLLDIAGREAGVAVRSSVYAPDSRASTFTGQHESYLNVRGEELLIDACRRCFASMFTDRAIAYRITHGIDHLAENIAIGVMPMVRADLGASGVIHSYEPESGFADVAVISANYGLGENVSLGLVEPDEFYIHKPTFSQGRRHVLRKSLGRKHSKMVLAYGRSRETIRDLPTPRSDRERYCITDEDAILLAEAALVVEQHYRGLRGNAYTGALAIEWAKDGLTGGLHLLQVRENPRSAPLPSESLEVYELKGTGPVIGVGRSVGGGVASGRARLIADAHHLSEFQPGEVLVADMTMPDWGPVMKTAAAMVINRGGRTCHAAIVARELGIPAIIGVENATEVIADGDVITVSCVDQEQGRIYAGVVPYEVHRRSVESLLQPRTCVFMSLGNPDRAFSLAKIPSDGVGLVRMEFIVSEHIGVHPMALIEHARLSPDVRARIAFLSRNHRDPVDFLVSQLAEGIGTIAAAFYPRPVLLRLSDLKSNEYASLLGGEEFEPAEDNPMLGFRGAARYTHTAYAAAFSAECAAIRRVRYDLGLDNLSLMIPFCRSVKEGERVLATLSEHGLRRGDGGLEVHLMCEVPNNILQIGEFCKLFDGISVGLNDLTQLVLGVDRDSEMVAFEFNERDPGVLAMVKQAIEGARACGRKATVCGQAVSDIPEIMRYLLELGTDAVTLNPDSVLPGTLKILEMERELGIRPRSAGV